MPETKRLSPAFLLYGTSPLAAKTLREGFERTIKANHPDVNYMDVSGFSSVEVGRFRALSESRGFRTTIYVMEAPLPKTITESWLKQQATYGNIRSLKPIVLTHGLREMVTHAETMLEAEGPAKPKEPTEADRVKKDQEAENIQTKQRQANQEAQAKMRDLEKKSREQAQKIAAPKTKKQE
jgi:hypothetical protein